MQILCLEFIVLVLDALVFNMFIGDAGDAAANACFIAAGVIAYRFIMKAKR